MEKARVQYDNLSLSSACEAVLEIGNAGNLYINERAPWSLLKQGGDAFDAAAKVLSIKPYISSNRRFCGFNICPNNIEIKLESLNNMFLKFRSVLTRIT